MNTQTKSDIEILLGVARDEIIKAEKVITIFLTM